MRIIIFISAAVCMCIMIAGCNPDKHEGTTAHHDDPPANIGNDVDSLLSPNRVLTIAHRGASGYAPEHTLESYKMGEALSADYLEIDLQMTADDELIAMHDNNLTRTTNSDGQISNYTLDEIQALDAGTWFNEKNPDLAQPVFNQEQVPSLDDILDEFSEDANFYIETKTPEASPDMVKKLMTTLADHDLLGEDVPEGKVIIQSCSKGSLLEVQKMDPSIPLIQLICFKTAPKISNNALEEIKKYAVGIGPAYQYLTKDYVQKIRNKGLLLHPFTVNEKSDMKRLIEWGVTGMFTNYPDRLDEVLDELDKN